MTRRGSARKMKMSQTKKAKTAMRRNAAAALREAEQYLLPTYKRPRVVFTHGRGSLVFDAKGKTYLDFLGGIAVNALGHAHPRIVRVVRREAGRAIHLSNLFHNVYQGPLARKLARWSGLERVFFANSGTEAVDGALKLARLFAEFRKTPRSRILALDNAFHGRTFGALSVTAMEKYRRPFEPLVPGVDFVRFNDTADLEAKLDSSVCALILETIQGEGGIHPVSEAFWDLARRQTKRYGSLLIADEIQCGLGRTGRYFAYQKFSSMPDMVLVAKPLAAGLPLGAILTTQEVAEAVSPGLHGTTFGGGPLVCAAALEFLRTVEEEGLLENVRARGKQLRAGIEELAGKFPVIREVRAEGLMIGVELGVEGAPFVAEALRRGLLINCTHECTLRLLPPFTVTPAQVREFLRLFEIVLAKTPRVVTEPESAPAADGVCMAKAAAR
jgi:acetylornithine/N-succinyldiaminopimelate aminotransferase